MPDPHDSPPLLDKHQTAWQLAAIQLAGWTSLPILATSILILQENSFLGAVLTIIVGNALLWFIRLGIISMGHDRRQSTLDISRDYLGHVGSYFIAVLLLGSTLAWFITQTSTASEALTHLVSIGESAQIDQFTQISVLLGIISGFLCMEGIVLLRKLCTLLFPFLLFAFFLILFFLPTNPHPNSNPLSFAGLPLVLATNLGVTSDLPTFFRHSGSWQTSIKALTIIQIASLVLGIFSLYFSSVLLNGFEINQEVVLNHANTLLRPFLVIFIFISVICANVANVYSASVGWELVAPKALIGRKEYLILGLGLTTIFILVSNLFSTELLLNITDSSLVNFCMILILGFVVTKSQKRLPTPLDQAFYFLAWLVSTLFNSLQYTNIIHSPLPPLALSGLIICATALLQISVKAFAKN